MKWVILSWRNVLRNTRRTIMAISIIATGTAAVLVALGYMYATFWGLQEVTIRGELGHIQVGAAGQFDTHAEAPMANGMTPEAVSALSAHAATMPAVQDVLRRIHFEGLISNGARTLAVIGLGAEPAKERRLAQHALPILDGRGLNTDRQADPFQVILAVDLAASLGAQVGDFVTVLGTTEHSVLNAVDLDVVGIYQTGVPEYDKRAIMVPLEAAQILLNTDKVSRTVITLYDSDETHQTMAALAAAHPDLDVRGWFDLAPFYHQVVTLYRGIFLVMGLIIIAVVLLSVTNTMLMSMMERVRESGTLMALGIPRWRLRTIFLMEGAIIGAIGGAFGVVVAAGLAYGVTGLNIMLPAPPGRTMPVPLMIFIDQLTSVTVFLVMIVLGAVAAWLPTRHIVRLKVVEALTHV